MYLEYCACYLTNEMATILRMITVPKKLIGRDVFT